MALFLALQAVAAVSFSRLPTSVVDARGTWDGGAYRRIAELGYPALQQGVHDPLVALYAFNPLFPLAMRALAATGLVSAGTAGSLLALVCAATAVAVVSVWSRPLLGGWAAYGVVIGLALWPAFPLLQMSYAEGPALLLLVVALKSLSERRYGVFAVSVLALGITRPLAGPVAVVALVHLLSRAHAGEPLRHLRRPAIAVVAAGIASIAWPVMASVVAGTPGVYLAAYAAFRRVGTPLSVLAGAVDWPLLGVLAGLVIGTGVWVALRFLPPGTPGEMRWWLMVYPAYVMGAAIISTSLIRYLLLLFPVGLVLVPALSRSRARPVVLAVLLPLAILGSAWWIREFVPPLVDGSVP